MVSATIHPAVQVVMEAMSVWDGDDKEIRQRRAMFVVSHLIEFGHIKGSHIGIIPHRPDNGFDEFGNAV